MLPYLRRRRAGRRPPAPPKPNATPPGSWHPGARLPIRRVGATALLIELAQPQAPAAWFTELSRRRATGELVASEIVPGERTVLLDGVPDLAATAALIRSWARAELRDGAGAPGQRRLVEIPVEYGGSDLAEVAEFWQTDEHGVVDIMSRIELDVAFCGFSPGFAYLRGLPAHLSVPRLSTPRARVPAGSVDVADSYVGIYPTASPGGWRLIGQTSMALFDLQLDPPAVLMPGVRVRLVETASFGPESATAEGGQA